MLSGIFILLLKLHLNYPINPKYSRVYIVLDFMKSVLILLWKSCLIYQISPFDLEGRPQLILAINISIFFEYCSNCKLIFQLFQFFCQNFKLDPNIFQSNDFISMSLLRTCYLILLKRFISIILSSCIYFAYLHMT